MNKSKKKSSFLALVLLLALLSNIKTEIAQAGNATLTIGQTIPSSNFSSPNLLATGGDYIYVASQSSPALDRINKTTSAVQSRITLTANVNKITYGAGFAWAILSDGSVAKISPAGSVTYSATVCTSPSFNDYIAVSGEYVGVTCFFTSVLKSIQISTNTIIGTASTFYPGGVVSDGTHFFVVDFNYGKFHKYIPSDLGITPEDTSVPLWWNNRVKITSDSTYAYVLNQNSGTEARLTRFKFSDQTYVNTDVGFGGYQGIVTDGPNLFFSSGNSIQSVDVDAGSYSSAITVSSPQELTFDGSALWGIVGGAVVKFGDSNFALPEIPGTPGTPTVVAGDGKVTVTPVAPGTGGTPVSYTVTATPGGAQCTVTLPATSCEVTGLTNGTSYTFTTTATNTAGTSSSSGSSASVTPGHPACLPSENTLIGDGTHSTISGLEYQIRTFTNISTCTWAVPAGLQQIDILIVGGGGGGGGGAPGSLGKAGGGGGGAGMVTLAANPSLSGKSSLTISIGAGGAAGGGGDHASSTPGVCGGSGGTSQISELELSATGGNGGVGGGKTACTSGSTSSGLSGAGGNSGNGLVGGAGSNSDSTFHIGGDGASSTTAGSASGIATPGTSTYFSDLTSPQLYSFGGGGSTWGTAPNGIWGLSETYPGSGGRGGKGAIATSGIYTYGYSGSEGQSGIAIIRYTLLAPPGTPGTPTVVAGDGKVTVTPVAPGTGGTPVSYTVTATPGGAQCTVTLPATSCEVTGLTNGTSYTFTTTATNTAGTSSSSGSSASVKPAKAGGGASRPPATNVLDPGTPGVPSVVVGDGKMTVTPTPPVNGAAPTSYVIRVTPGGAQCTVTLPATACEVTGLTNGIPYMVSSVAVNGRGSSSPSPSIEVVTKSSTSKSPTGSEATQVPNTPKETNLRFTAQGKNLQIATNYGGPKNFEPSSYFIEVSPKGLNENSCITDSANGSCSISNLKSGVIYSVKVTASNLIGDSKPFTSTSKFVITREGLRIRNAELVISGDVKISNPIQKNKVKSFANTLPSDAVVICTIYANSKKEFLNGSKACKSNAKIKRSIMKLQIIKNAAQQKVVLQSFISAA